MSYSSWLCFRVVPAAAANAAPKARIAVSVAGLPPGTAPSISVKGPGFKKAIKRKTTLRNLKAGTYTFTVRKAPIRSGRKGVKSGSVIYPAQAKTKVKVKAGRLTKVKLRYGTIINANVKETNLAKAKFTGDAIDPKTLTLPASSGVKVGAILTATPTKAMPAGVFHHVTKVRRSGSKLILTLKPAHLAEAFPQLTINSTLKLQGDGKVAMGKASASALDPLVGSLGTPHFRCAYSLADSGITASTDLGVDAKVEIDFPKKWGIPVGLPHGELAMTLHGDAALDVMIRKNIGCTALANLPPISGAIPVGPVVVPVYAQIGVYATASIASDIRMHAGAGFSLKAGMGFKGTDTWDTSSASSYADASASGSGKFVFGPQIRFAVGAAGVADVHFDAKPGLAFSASLDLSCSLDFEGNSQIGVSFGPFQINQPLPAPKWNLYRCPPGGNPPPTPTPTPAPQPSGKPALKVEHTGPLGAFLNQRFGYAIRVTNTGTTAATGVEVVDTLPSAGTFIDSDPAGTPAAPDPGDRITIGVGDIAAGDEKTVTVSWRAPGEETVLTNRAFARAANVDATDSESASVPVGTTANCNPCGADAAGTGLRNRDHGAITIDGVPAGATVGRAVLVWGILYNGERPRDTITFQGQQVKADIESTTSGNLCWGDSDTVGYAADVTQYVTGNGTFHVTDPPRGTTRPDDDPAGELPYTDGATLVVFYVGGGAQNQVLSDFSYDTDTDGDGAIARSFSGINSVGGVASVILGGPDGQANAGETFVFTGSDTLTFVDAFNGSDPHDGPAFIDNYGSLWDTDSFDVSTILPAGQATLRFDHTQSDDCIGVGAAVLQVSQRTPQPIQIDD